MSSTTGNVWNTYRMYEVFYKGEKIGMVKATPKTVKMQAASLWACTPRSTPLDPNALSWDDTRHDKYKHMM